MNVDTHLDVMVTRGAMLKQKVGITILRVIASGLVRKRNQVTQTTLRRAVQRKQCEHGPHIIFPECTECLTHRRLFDDYHFNYCERYSYLHPALQVTFRLAFSWCHGQ